MEIRSQYDEPPIAILSSAVAIVIEKIALQPSHLLRKNMKVLRILEQLIFEIYSMIKL